MTEKIDLKEDEKFWLAIMRLNKLKGIKRIDKSWSIGRLKTTFEFILWCRKHSVKPTAIEQVVIGNGYGGRVDLVVAGIGN